MKEKTTKLYSREDFRQSVFERDKHHCVSCGATDVKFDAHHIMERRLWPDGGYYLDNGVTVCEPCHLKCESTQLSTQHLRELAGIKTVMLPPHLYRDQEYDKWGNPIMANGLRLEGELANDESVKKVLTLCEPSVQFSNRVKYPRSYHLPWSPGTTKDDRVVPDCSQFEGREVVVTLKMDGENTTMYSDGLHARSIDYSPHESRNWVKALWSRICGDIPETWRICGENIFARHSVYYDDLPSYFMVFSFWDGLTCMSWDETEEWSEILGLETVPVIYRGLWDEEKIKSLRIDTEKDEGYVVRLADSFHYREFRSSLAKYVREGHVAGSHWKSRMITPNLMRSKDV